MKGRGRTITLALLATAAAARAQPDDDRGLDATWELGATSGIAMFTYGSTRSLRPAPRPLVFPSTPPPCPTCISSAGEGVAVTIARFVDGPLRASGTFAASREPAFALDAYTATAGAGIGTRMGSAPLFAHIDAQLGAARVVGPVAATSFAFRMATGVDYRFADHVEAGIEASYEQLWGDQPAGDASRGVYGAHVGYRFR